MRLTIRDGDGRRGTTFDVDGDLVVVGRDADCDVVLDDERVSRRHASFERLGGAGWLVRDLDSANGTWVDGMRLTSPVVLGGGEELRLGGTLLLLEPRASGRAPAIGRRGIAMVAALAVLVGAAGAAIGAVLAREPVPGFPADTGAMRAGPLTGESAPGATPGEAALLERIPGWQRDAGCWRPAPALARVRGTLAAVGCLGETGTILYWRFESVQAMDAWYDRVIDGLDLTPDTGACKEQAPAEQAWAVEGEVGGRLACSAIDGRTVFAWTSDEHAIGAMLSLNRPGGASYADVYGTWLRSGPVDATEGG